jgi:hypothetical protein
MATTKHTGKHSLVKRLTAQVGSKSLAENLLKKRGDMTERGELTAKGKKRDDMTAAQRAKDRAARRSKRPPEDYKYNVKTNIATLKKGK